MRANEFLVEVEMTPNALRREASKINAKAGMEFEMYVPGASGPDEDAESEADYEQDESANDIDDIIAFFFDGAINSRRDVVRLREELTEAYDEYVMNEQDEQWYEEGKALLREYIEENDWDEDAEAERTLEDKVNDEWESQGRSYEKVKDEWYNDQELPDQRDWLRSEGYHHMSDIEDNFIITWPHWTTPDSGGDIDIETVGTMFSQAIGKEVMTGGYHRAGRSDTAYSLEPDGSLEEPNYSQDGGLEFISPPMSIPDLIDDLKKVKAWADKTGCYTNESTGLHINVSVPQGAHRDYVKLALLLGDDYILEKFGREANTFCKSSLAQVKQYANNEANAQAVLEKMRTRLDSMASRAIHTGETNKYVSINNKGNYVEFRSPGGDWLGDNFDQIENTLLRTVVALDASSDPMKYRKEYLKKLYKILAPKGERDPLAIFAQYVSGDMSKDTMKHLLKQIQQRRPAKKGATTGEKYWYEVSMSAGHSIEVVATDIPSAIKAAELHWGLRPGWAGPLQAVAVRPYEEQTDATPTMQGLGARSNSTQGATPSTEQQLSAAYDQAFPPSEAPLAPDTNGPGTYKLVNTSNNEIIWAWHSESRQAAHDFAVQWLNDHPDAFDPEQRRYFQLRRS
jgi:hypothetical protein